MFHGGEATKIRPKAPSSTPGTAATSGISGRTSQLPVTVDLAEGGAIIWRVEGRNGPIFISLPIRQCRETRLSSAGRTYRAQEKARVASPSFGP